MKKKETKETVEEYLKRGGEVTVLPDEIVWEMFPPQEKLSYEIRILDYERDHKHRRT
jgi:hypothetical protein|tara:strand:- start:2850 stop:3020 length:171 start_codon:yes stop_codon:yes gene_type:complete